MDRIERLEAIEAVRDVKARYFRAMDGKDWAGLATCFTSDLDVITPAGVVYAKGGPVYAAALQHSLTTAVSCHQGLTAEIDVRDFDHAKAVWAMQDVIEWQDRHPKAGWKSIVGRGHYHETYRVEDGAWRIATLTLTRIRLDITWPDGTKTRELG